VRTLVLYYSKFGNTQLAAETIAGKLNEFGSVAAITLEKFKDSRMDNIDVVVVGSPTHKMNIPIEVRDIFAKIPKRTLKGKSFAAFDTSYQMSWILNKFTANKKLARKLRKLGGRQILPPMIFTVQEKEGPLTAGEIKRCSAWAESIHEMWLKMPRGKNFN